MAMVAAESGSPAPPSTPAPKPAAVKESSLDTNPAAAPARSPPGPTTAAARLAAAAAATCSPEEQLGIVPLPLALGAAVGCVSLGVAGLAALLVLRSRRRGRGTAAAAGGNKGKGPCAKLKATSKCVPLADGSGCVVRREIAADNSCLFNSVGYAMHKSRTRAPHLRTVVAQQVSSDRTTYSDAFLGMSNEAYCNWIRQPYNWGGGIELSILAQAYGMEIAAWNIESCKEHVFGEESGYKRQAMVIYNGVHYDALAVCTGPRASPEEDETTYNPRTKRGKMIIAAARKLVELAYKESQFHGAAAKKQQQAAAAAAAAKAAKPPTATKAAATPPSMNGTANAHGATTGSADAASSGGDAAVAAAAPVRKVAAGSTGRITRRVARSGAAAVAAAETGGGAAGAAAAAADGSGTAAPAAVGGVARLSCGDCGEVFVGAAAARQHALSTGHQNYQEEAA